MSEVGERGSVLVLVPAGFLVLIVLAALAVDSAVSYLGQQQLHDTLSVAASDAATAGVDSGAFYKGGTVTLDPTATARTVCQSVLAQNDSGLHDLHVWMAITDDAVVLEGSASVDAVFGRAVPGLRHRGVRSSAEAVLAGGASNVSSAFAPPGSGFVPLNCS